MAAPRAGNPSSSGWLLGVARASPSCSPPSTPGRRPQREEGHQDAIQKLHRALVLMSHGLKCHPLCTPGFVDGPANNSATMEARTSRCERTTSCFCHRPKPEKPFLTRLPLFLQLSTNYFLALGCHEGAPVPSELGPPV